MKKLLPSITLAFASLASFSGLATAGHTFGLFTGCHCCKSCGGTITLRQYNAFSPVACGSMMFQGCVVAPPQGGYGFDGGSGDCTDGSCAAASQAPALPNNGYAYSYPIQTYPGIPMQQTAQMQQMQQMAQMQQMQQMQQMAQMQQMPAAQPAAPAPTALPAAARLP